MLDNGKAEFGIFIGRRKGAIQHWEPHESNLGIAESFFNATCGPPERRDPFELTPEMALQAAGISLADLSFSSSSSAASGETCTSLLSEGSNSVALSSPASASSEESVSVPCSSPKESSNLASGARSDCAASEKVSADAEPKEAKVSMTKFDEASAVDHKDDTGHVAEKATLEEASSCGVSCPSNAPVIIDDGCLQGATPNQTNIAIALKYLSGKAAIMRDIIKDRMEMDHGTLAYFENLLVGCPVSRANFIRNCGKIIDATKEDPCILNILPDGYAYNLDLWPKSEPSAPQSPP